tara:strand:- start:1201 stop:1737 length:537 start_codon:yes stop_codon:yes gene_type:complete
VLVRSVSRLNPVDDQKSPTGYQIEGADYCKLKLFFISLLWRASVSSQPMFTRVNLGKKFEERAKHLILTVDPGSDDEFAVTLAGFEDKFESGIGILDPIKARFAERNYYIFYLHHLIAYIKVDARPCEPPWDGTILRRHSPAIIVNRGEFRKSKEFPVMQRILSTNHQYIPNSWSESN